MEKIFLRHNLPSIMFSLFLFLFAIEPVFEKIIIIDYIVWALIMLCVIILFVSVISLIIKYKMVFILSLTSKSRFSFFNITSALIGLIISYSFNSHLVNVWIFLLVLNIVDILTPDPFKQK